MATLTAGHLPGTPGTFEQAAGHLFQFLPESPRVTSNLPLHLLYDKKCEQNSVNIIVRDCANSPINPFKLKTEHYGKHDMKSDQV